MAKDIMSAEVIPFPGPAMPGLGIAATASPGQMIGGSQNEVWLCQAYGRGDQGLMLYVKPALSPRRMMIEVLAAQVGQCMGLPCPDPFLVTVNPIHVGRPRGPKLIAFGSEQIGNRSLARTLHDPDALLDALNSQKLTDLLCCFDEFIANGVRGPRDVIFDPEHGIGIIDHEGAMEGHLRPDESVNNWIAAKVLAILPNDQRASFLKRLRARAAKAEVVRRAVVPSGAQFHQDGVNVYMELLTFLRERLNHLDRLLSARFLPEQGYLTEAPKNDASDRASDV